MRERLHFYLKDVRGFAYDVVNAVLAADADDVRDAIARAEALTAARESADFAAVSAAFKRIKNILRQAEEKRFAIGSPRAGQRLRRRRSNLRDAASRSRRKVAKLRAAARVRRGAGHDRHAAASGGCVLRQGDGARSRSAVRGAHLGLIDEVLSGFSGIADFSEIVTA